jgi:arsenate reductase
MAEALAKKYGSDVIEASSAGSSPAMIHQVPTRAVLAEKNIDLGEHVPRFYQDLDLLRFDIVVNMSGRPIQIPRGPRLETWDVRDPYGKSEDHFRETRETLERMVMNLILRIRTKKI